MSTKRRKGSRQWRDPLPVDLLLEILARTDITTVVRCAATGRTLRRAILEPAFRRRLASDDGGCDPALLLAVSYLEHDFHKAVTTQRVIQTPATTQLRARLDADNLRAPLKPVASRDGLLLLRRLGERHSDKVKLQARDTFTGHVTSLPPTTLPHAYLHVVLAVDRRARRCSSFELLVADPNLSYRTFSSKNRRWTDIRGVHVPHPTQECDSSSCPAVVGRTVYWPCRVTGVSWTHILALQVDAGEATMTELPLVSQDPLLVAQVRGQLSVLAEESLAIAMWTLTSAEAGTWSRRVVISKLEIARQVGLPSPTTFIFEGFGERSGAVILNLFDDGSLLRLDLGIIKQEAPVVTWLTPPGNVVCVKELFLHEVDLSSVLQAMKYL